ncbi:hypothetical protein BH11MYX2_BH11MYX2_12120 [soil metagenome]
MVADADGALRCRTCGKRWPPTLTACPHDGALLATLPAGFDTTIDLGPASDDATIPFNPFSSDVRTHIAPRPQHDEPAQPAAWISSDPPTKFVRRAEGHIELPPGSMVGEEYEIDRGLGAGAMGEVYAGRHVKLGKRVAIKVISPRLSEDAAAIERFAQEARTLAQMHHPGLVEVLGFGELADHRAYFVMELLSGMSMFDRLQGGRLDRAEALDIFGQAARALEAAHTHGVVHRDLKPENIFLAQVTNEPRPIVKILDFGLARLLIEVDRRAERTQSGVVIGTAMYLSPEQARGPNVDGRTDIYALGCIGYELFLGRHPFADARTLTALIAAHMHDTPPLPSASDPNIPPELDLLLCAMLAKDPQYRPTLRQIRSVIESVGSPAPAPVQVRAETEHVPTAPTLFNWRTGAIGAVVMSVGILIGAVARCSGSETSRSSAPAYGSNWTDAGARSGPTALANGRDVVDAVAVDSATMPVTPDLSIDAGDGRQDPAAIVTSIDAGLAVDEPVQNTPPPDGPRATTALDETVKATPSTPLPPSPPPSVRAPVDTPKIQSPVRDQSFNPFKKATRQ